MLLMDTRVLVAFSSLFDILFPPLHAKLVQPPQVTRIHPGKKRMFFSSVKKGHTSWETLRVYKANTRYTEPLR